MFRSRTGRVIALAFALTLTAGACGDDDDGGDASSVNETTTTEAMSEESMAEDEAMSEESGDSEMASAEICETDALVEAVEGGPEEGTLEGMTDDPVATAASNNPVLTTLVTAVTEADLVDTLNNAEAVTVFAPTDCAFAELDEATLNAAMEDPSGLLTDVLGYHVVATEELKAADLADKTELETLSGEMLPISVDGETVTLNDGAATVLVPDIETANATVHLIDAVMLPPTAG